MASITKCALYYVMKQNTKFILDTLDNNDDVVQGNSRLPEEKLHCSDLYTEVFKRWRSQNGRKSEAV